MSSNLNPLGPPPGLLDHLRSAMPCVTALPEVDAYQARKAFAQWSRCDVSQVVGANGTTQIIYTLPLVLKSRRAVIVGPTYADYADACQRHGVEYRHAFLTVPDFEPKMELLQQECQSADTVFICNPNNPTGTLWPSRQLQDLFSAFPHTTFVVDESYMPFISPDRSQSVMHSQAPNVIVLHSLSKIFCIPGLRIGLAVAPKPLALQLSSFGQPWEINALAQQAILYLMDQPEEIGAFVDQTHRFLNEERQKLYQALDRLPWLTVYPSQTTFSLAQLTPACSVQRLCAHLLTKGIVIRNCANFHGLSDQFVRISLKSERHNRKLADVLAQVDPEQIAHR